MTYFIDPETETSALIHLFASYFRSARHDPRNVERWKHLEQSAASTGRKRRLASDRLIQAAASEVLGISPRSYSSLENEHNLCKSIVLCRFMGRCCDEDTGIHMLRDIQTLYRNMGQSFGS